LQGSIETKGRLAQNANVTYYQVKQVVVFPLTLLVSLFFCVQEQPVNKQRLVALKSSSNKP